MEVFFCQKSNEKTRLAGALNWLETHKKQCAGQGSLRVVVSGSVWVESYLKHLCDGRSYLVANFVVTKVELLDGGVLLSENERKDTVSGAQKWRKTRLEGFL